MALDELMASAPVPFCTVGEGREWLAEARRGMASQVNRWEKRDAKRKFLFSFGGVLTDPADATTANELIGGTTETHSVYRSGLVDLVVEFYDHLEVALQKDLKRRRPVLTALGRETAVQLMAEAKERRGY